MNNLSNDVNVGKPQFAFAPTAAPTVVPTGTVPEGKRVDFLTGKLVKDSPEEYVRQNIEKALVRQYKYPARDCAPEFRIDVGSAKKRIDIGIFPQGGRPHPGERSYCR